VSREQGYPRETCKHELNSILSVQLVLPQHGAYGKHQQADISKTPVLAGKNCHSVTQLSFRSAAAISVLGQTACYSSVTFPVYTTPILTTRNKLRL
jgi:hypothetical protein